MEKVLNSVFSGNGFMPHGHCYLWTPGLVWLHVIADGLIVLAYYSIPVALVYLMRKRTDFRFGWMFVCFAVFILACGTTHLLEIWNIWHAQYWVSGSIKAVTALASVPTAILLIRLIPAALALPSPATLARANAELESEIQDRRSAEDRGRVLNSGLELRVAKRTAELNAATGQLTSQVLERQRTETALAASELRYRRLFESAKDGILILDAETGMVVDVNPFLITTLGFTREQFLSKAIWELGFFKDIWANAEKFAELKEKEYVRYEHLPLKTADGQSMDVEFVSNVYLVNGSKVIQCNIRDVTARRRAEESLHELNENLEQRVSERTTQLEAANKELDAFSYSVSHDLRAPLRAVDGFSQAMLEDYGAQLPEEGQRYLRTIRDGTHRMGTLIDDLLAFSRLSRLPLQKRLVNPEELVRSAVAELNGLREARQVEIHVGDLPPCQGDPGLLKQVWVNLLSNAFKYTRRRHPAIIEVGCTKEADEYVYFVRDNGTGFDMRYVNKLFGVFQRLHRAEDFEGTGVGLAIVHRIVHRHGGRIWADAAVDRGATFHFTLGQEAAL